MSAEAPLRSTDRLQPAMDRNMAAYWAPYGRGAGAELHEAGGTTWIYTGIATPLFNGVSSANLDEEGVKALVASLKQRIAQRGAPAFWWIGPLSRPENIGALLEQRGLKPAGSAPGMAVDLEAIDGARARVPGFEMTAVDGPELRALWARIAAAGTGLTATAIAQLEKLEPTIDDPRYARQRRYLGTLEGKPVASSALLLEAGVAGVYAVATLPEARKRGIGRAMTLAPLLEARALGYRTGILQSSSAGYPIYRKLGFADVCKYALYLQS